MTTKPKKLTTKQKLLDEARKAGLAQAALESLGLPDLSSPDFNARVKRMQGIVNPTLTHLQVNEKPEACGGCGDCGGMDYRKVSVGGKDEVRAWVCDACGHAHIPCQHVPDFKSLVPAQGTDEWVVDVTCKKCRRGASTSIDPTDFCFD